MKSINFKDTTIYDFHKSLMVYYDLCKKKQKSGEKLGFLLKAFVEEYEKESKGQTTKEVNVSFVKKNK